MTISDAGDAGFDVAADAGDAGESDASVSDAGDAGELDASIVDAGDAGEGDAGPCAQGCNCIGSPMKCVDDRLWVCDDTPTPSRFVLAEDCAETGKHCVVTGIVPHCEEPPCTPGEPLCVGDRATVCDALGQGPAPGGTDCMHDDELCGLEGVCAPVICESGVRKCNGDEVHVCAGRGTAWVLSHACDSSTESCEEQGSDAECVFACTPSAAACDGNQLTTCANDGRSLSPGGVDCTADGKVCDPVGASCKPKICEPHTTYCKGNALWQCTHAGAAEMQLESCQSGCKGFDRAAYCEVKSCFAGARLSCQDNLAFKCRSDGKGVDPASVIECKAEDDAVCFYGLCFDCEDPDVSNEVAECGPLLEDDADAGTDDVDAGGPPTTGDEDAGGTSIDAGATDAGAPETTRCSTPMPAPTATRRCPMLTPAPLKLTLVASPVETDEPVPVFLTSVPNDPRKRLFIAYQSGHVFIYENGERLTPAFLDLSNIVEAYYPGGEIGLLGMAFDPDYEHTGRFWVNYTKSSDLVENGVRSVVESYRVSDDDPDLADPTSGQELLSFEQPEKNHNGGMLAFGPDGCLYIGSGDGGGERDRHASEKCPYGNAQCLNTELGKILRIDVDRPNVGAPGNIHNPLMPHIWDYGLRNPWRFSFDRATGDMYIADVGENDWEELNIELRGHGRNNYGWRITEGRHCLGGPLSPTGTCRDHGVDFDYGTFVAPVFDYPHATLEPSDAAGSITGGYVYRGSKIPSLNGYYLYADFMMRRTWALAWNGSDLCSAPIELTSQLSPPAVVHGPPANITSFGEDSEGELYVLRFDGAVWRIDPK